MIKELIESVLKHWNIQAPYLKQIYGKIPEDADTASRIICRIGTKTQDYVLKGIPAIPEATIRSNVQAYLFLGNEHAMAPKVYPNAEGTYYIREQQYYFFLMEYIDGRPMEETVSDEYLIGQLTRKLHSLTNEGSASPFTQSKDRYYGWFAERSFKKEFDEILDSLPDFASLSQCFVHTDIGPHNTMMRAAGEVCFIDLDDSGIGSRYLDLGWPFIMQFVDFNHETEEMCYRFDLARSFLAGYYGDEKIPREEYDLLFQGAVQMHIAYMKVYGPEAVLPLWRILKFGMAQKEPLWALLKNSGSTQE